MKANESQETETRLISIITCASHFSSLPHLCFPGFHISNDMGTTLATSQDVTSIHYSENSQGSTFKSPNSTETGATYAQDSRSLGWCQISVMTKAEEEHRHLLFHLHVCWHDLFSVRFIYDFFLMYNCRTWPWFQLQNSNWFIHTESPNCNLPQLTIHLTFKLLKNRQLYAN